MVTLSKRLQAVTALAEPGETAADIGCDHGYVSIRLIQQRHFSKVIAMDVRPGPLETARKNIALYGMEDAVELRQSDGLRMLESGEADCMICAGMGGALICHILGNDLEKAKAMKQIILQPQSEISLVRGFLRRHGFAIVKEDMVKEDGKYYTMFRAIRQGEAENPSMITEYNALNEGQTVLSAGREVGSYECRKGWMCDDLLSEDRLDIYDEFGRLLLEKRHPVLYEWLMHEQAVTGDLIFHLQRVIGAEGDAAAVGRQKQRLTELEGKQKRIESALKYYL